MKIRLKIKEVLKNMTRFKIKITVWVFLALAILGLFFSMPASEQAQAQQPTGSIPTVTGTPSGAIVTVMQIKNSLMCVQDLVPIFIRELAFWLQGKRLPHWGVPLVVTGS